MPFRYLTMCRPRRRPPACQYCHARCHIASGRIVSFGTAPSYLVRNLLASYERDHQLTPNFTKRGLVEQADKGLIVRAGDSERGIYAGRFQGWRTRHRQLPPFRALVRSAQDAAMRFRIRSGITRVSYQFPLSRACKRLSRVPHYLAHRMKVFRDPGHKPPTPSPSCIS
jgi:hypothetical protein